MDDEVTHNKFFGENIRRVINTLTNKNKRKMEIKTKFNVNDLVQHKFQNTNTTAHVKLFYEVLFMDTQTCSAGTQVFYTCRPIMITYDKDWKDGVKTITAEDFNPGRTKESEYQKFREDEIIPCSEKVKETMKTLNINQNPTK